MVQVGLRRPAAAPSHSNTQQEDRHATTSCLPPLCARHPLHAMHCPHNRAAISCRHTHSHTCSAVITWSGCTMHFWFLVATSFDSLLNSCTNSGVGSAKKLSNFQISQHPAVNCAVKYTCQYGIIRPLFNVAALTLLTAHAQHTHSMTRVMHRRARQDSARAPHLCSTRSARRTPLTRRAHRPGCTPSLASVSSLRGGQPCRRVHVCSQAQARACMQAPSCSM
jgi:hypothetical protein